MKEELYKQVFALVFGGLLGVIIKYWYDYRGMVHKELWSRRYETYKKMFLLAGRVPLYPVREVLAYADLLRISESMRDWFFQEGGMLLSVKTRNKYFKVQKNIRGILDVVEEKKMKSDAQITEDEYEGIRVAMSQLRRAMTDDLMSRQRM